MSSKIFSEKTKNFHLNHGMNKTLAQTSHLKSKLWC